MGDVLEGPSTRFMGRMTRREALQALGLAGLGVALLSACGQQAQSPSQPGGAPAAQPAAAPAASKPAAGAPKDGGHLRFYIAPENTSTFDPYLNVSVRTQ